MKSLFYLLSILLIAFACVFRKPEKEEIRFINEVVTKAKVANKLLILEFWSPDCAPCTRLMQDIFDNERNSEFLNKNFVVVKISTADSVFKPLREYFHLEYDGSVVFMDMNGNEIDRTVNYNGNRDAYLNFLLEVSEGRNLYSVVFSTYKKDTLNVTSNYILAKKLLFRHQIKDAIKQFNKVILYDPDNKFGYNQDCKLKIFESEQILSDGLP